jgi:hypothetical protein
MIIRKYLLKAAVFLCIAPVLGGCWDNIEGVHQDATLGYRPVYGPQETKEITFLSPRTLKNPGKIYVYGPYLLINEKGEGIHVFNNADPSDPKPEGFIQLLGSTDMAIRNNILYADHMGNLVALQINSFADVENVGSLPLQNWNLGLPPPRQSHFECVDPDKGLVIAWQKVLLQNPDCYAH